MDRTRKESLKNGHMGEPLEKKIFLPLIGRLCIRKQDIELTQEKYHSLLGVGRVRETLRK